MKSPDSSFEEDIPETFWQPRRDDLQREQEKIKQTQEGGMLKTKAMREMDRVNKARQYLRTVVRIRFPDKYVLEGLFHPWETFGDLMSFVRTALSDSKRPFYLYKSPPVTKYLDETRRFVDEGLVPSALLNFSWNDASSSTMASGAFLAEDLLQHAEPLGPVALYMRGDPARKKVA